MDHSYPDSNILLCVRNSHTVFAGRKWWEKLIVLQSRWVPNTPSSGFRRLVLQFEETSVLHGNAGRLRGWHRFIIQRCHDGSMVFTSSISFDHIPARSLATLQIPQCTTVQKCEQENPPEMAFLQYFDIAGSELLDVDSIDKHLKCDWLGWSRTESEKDSPSEKFLAYVRRIPFVGPSSVQEQSTLTSISMSRFYGNRNYSLHLVKPMLTIRTG